MPIQSLNDVELIRLSMQSDNAAFAELVRRHDRAVFGLIARYVDRAEDAKDVYQEVFLRVHRGLRSFEFRSDFSTWIYRIAVNACLDYARRRKRSVSGNATTLTHGSGESVDAGSEPVSQLPGPDQRAIDAEIAGRVQKALMHLPPRQRMVFLLRHDEGRPLKEIARIIGCREGTVKRYLFEATQAMRGALRDLLRGER